MRPSAKALSVSALALLGLGAAASPVMDAVDDQIAIWRRGAVLYDPLEVRFHVLDGFSAQSPTSLRFGPDDRLYVATQYGRLTRLSLARTDAGGYRAVEIEEIPLIEAIPNHNDDGTPQPGVRGRLIAGLEAAGSAAEPVLFVSSSDPRLEHPLADTNSGVISRLERFGELWRKTDLVRGLPRSQADHATLGLHWDARRRRLYVSQGSNTNAGAPDIFFHYVPEYALSAAILELDLDAIGPEGFDLPTLAPSAGGPFGGPFGGRRGANQAITPTGGPVRLFATGVRNAYRIVERRGSLFTIDNGPNPGFGGYPVMRDGAATNEPAEGGEHLPGVLLEIRDGVYYGHPNPTRASRLNLFGDASPVARERPDEGVPVPPGRKPGERAQFWPSVNGLSVYRSGALGPDWREAFVAVGFDRNVTLLSLGADGATAQRILVGQAGEMPLDVVARGDDEPFPGTIWIADYGSGRILVVEPAGPLSWLSRIRALPRQVLLGLVE